MTKHKKEKKKEKKEQKKQLKLLKKEQKRAEKIEKQVAKVAGYIEDGKWKKIAEKLKEHLEEKREEYSDKLCTYHAALAFVLELLNNVNQNHGDLKQRRISTSVPQLRYLQNVDGEDLFWRIGFKPGEDSYILPDYSLPLVEKSIPILKLEIAETRLRIDKYCEGIPRLGKSQEGQDTTTTTTTTSSSSSSSATKPEDGEAKEAKAEPGSLSDVQNRAIGALLGATCGDILGAPVETWRPEVIDKWFYKLIQFQDLPHAGDAPGGTGRYTGDTELMLTCCKSIFVQDCLDMKHMAQSLAEVYVDGDPRAYPQCMEVVCGKLEDQSYLTTASFWGKDGAQHNEGLTRVLPVAITFREAPAEVLDEAVKSLLVISTTHVDGIKAVQTLARLERSLFFLTPDTFDPLGMLDEVFQGCTCVNLRGRIDYIRKQAKDNPIDQAKGIYRVPPKTYEDLADVQQAEALEALAVALCVFTEWWHDPLEAVVQAVHKGGDTNTIAGVVGALCGALHGYDWLPKEWFEQMENLPETGRDTLIQVASKIANLSYTKMGKIKCGKASQHKAKYALN